MDRIGAAGLRRYLERERPDAVVHLHPTPAGAMVWLRAHGMTAVPHAIVFTDFTAHPQWIHVGLERYFVPTETVRAGVVVQGIRQDRVVASGLPVDSSFAVEPDRLALRAELGLPADLPVVLVTGGMRGLLRGVAEGCAALASLERPFVAIAVCGDHQRLAARLDRRYGRDARFRILGRVHDMARVMGAADFVVSKAGAVTCAEPLPLDGRSCCTAPSRARSAPTRRASSPRAWRSARATGGSSGGTSTRSSGSRISVRPWP
jgi:processive 1,2-diacylglycerol beta-glucosyltransferase